MGRRCVLEPGYAPSELRAQDGVIQMALSNAHEAVNQIAGVHRVGLAHEFLRRVIGLWPFERGTQRIPSEMGKVFPSLNANGVIGGVGARGVLFPFQSGDVAHPAYWFLYEKGVRRVLTRLLTPGAIFIDIGAHRGWHSGYALSLVGSDGCVIACEPHPAHAARLCMLASLNPGRDIRVNEVAVSRASGEATLLVSEHEGWHTIVPEFEEVSNVPRSPVRVAALSFDDLLDGYADLALRDEPRRVLVKIDAEGAELDILRGAKQTLNLPSIRAFVIECTGGPGIFRERSKQCVEILRDTGWTSSVITHNGTRPWMEDDTTRQVNILAVRE